jgi:hypothetical protein
LSRIVRGDPGRRHLHDYLLVDLVTNEDVAGFDNEVEAMAYLAVHLDEWRGRVIMITTLHPDGCECPDAPAQTSMGRLRRGHHP